MKVSFSIEGLQDPTEVLVAWQAVEQHRQAQVGPATDKLKSQVVGQLDGITTALAQRIFQGLTFRPLGPRYKEMLKVWFDAPSGAAVRIADLAKTVGGTADELRANLSKLSARMKRIATPEEIATLRTPFMLLAEIEYDETNSSQHRLTPAGREAVRKYIKP